MCDSSRMGDHILNLLHSTRSRRLQANKYLVRLKRIDCTTSIIVEVSSAVTVSSIVITLSASNPVSLIVGAVFSTISTVVSAARKAYDMQHKIDVLTATVNDLHAVEREIRLVRTLKVPVDEYERVVSDFNERINLIESHAIPMHVEYITDNEDCSTSESGNTSKCPA